MKFLNFEDGAKKIGDGQQVAVSFQALFAEDTFSFYFKSGSESCCDGLRLMVDGAQVFFSNAQEWTYHEIKWVYAKDGSASNGTDALYLDNINFTE